MCEKFQSNFRQNGSTAKNTFKKKICPELAKDQVYKVYKTKMYFFSVLAEKGLFFAGIHVH